MTVARLLVDGMCGRLARYLRFCGHDTAYVPDRGLEGDDAIIRLAEAEDRIVVTRDRDLASRASGSIRLESTNIDGQLRAVADVGISLELPERPTRCGRCNGSLRRVSSPTNPPSYVADDADAVFRCDRCGQWFWRGSHWERVDARLEPIRSDVDPHTDG